MNKNAQLTYPLNATNLILLFTVCSILGTVIETIFCYCTRGIVESRKGMLYGPFNQVYGLGAVLMALILQPLCAKGLLWVFAGGALLGGAFEFVCSWVQERMLQTVSWDYKHHAFSIGGRTSLPIMLLWGLLAILFIKAFYPGINTLLQRIHRPFATVLSRVLAVFLCVNLLLSGAAVSRWKDRLQGIPAKNSFAAFMDEKYPNEKLEKIFPSMQFPHQKKKEATECISSLRES